MRKQKHSQNPDAYTCSICRKQCVGFSNNAYPVNNGRCCNECNADTVIPTRIARLYSQKEET